MNGIEELDGIGEKLSWKECVGSGDCREDLFLDYSRSGISFIAFSVENKKSLGQSVGRSESLDRIAGI